MPPRSLKRRKRASSIVHAVSSKTGLTHILGGIPAWEKDLKRRENERRKKEDRDLVESLQFWDWFNIQPPLSLIPDLQWEKSVFRLVYGGFSPFSIVGSISSGGRFNVGAAQVSREFPSVRQQGCLYAASSLHGAYAEVQGPAEKIEEYELVPKKPFILWDLKKILAKLADPLLEDRVKNTPLAALWALQKVPMTSQLLAYQLRSIGGDGIIFPSIKESSAMNLAFFFKTDRDTEEAFKAKKIN